MPERPDLEYVIPRLEAALTGATVSAVRVLDPVVVRVGAAGKLEDLLPGRVLRAVTRHLHFVVFHLDPPDLTLLVHPMLAGRFQVVVPGTRDARDLVVALALGGQELRILDDVRMGKVYLMPSTKLNAIPGYAPVGVDVLGPTFSAAVLADRLRGRRDQIKLFLLDKGAVDAFGNAYADEVLFAAGLHPKRRCSELSPADIERLAEAMPAVLREARAEIEERAPPLEEKVRDFLHVRKRVGAPCPRCGATIRTAGVRGHDAYFCPNCQPDVAGRGLVDWRTIRSPTR